MTKYIEREALMNFANNHVNSIIDTNDIARFPIADVVEVRHGQWIEVEKTIFGTSYYRCSVCEGFMPYYNGYKYCPNCGAKMDGGTE